MRVRYFPAARYDACAHYRMVLPAGVLAAAGMDVSEGEREALQAIRHWPDLEIHGALPLEADVAVFQRMTLPDTVALIPYWQAKGTAVVIDVDDLLCDIPRGNPAHRVFNAPETHWRWLDQACELADMVTVSTPALAVRYGSHGRVRVLENCVPERYLRVERPTNERPVVGWAGLTTTHQGDLEVVRSAIAVAVQQGDADFRAIGDPTMMQKLGIDGEWVPFVPFEKYPEALAGLDVGLAPLADTPFGRAKSWLKVLEGAAVGVAMISSPLPEYMRLGIGRFAEHPRAWKAVVRSLLTRPELRAEVAEHGRAMAAEWTYEKQAVRWMEAWTAALQHRRGLVAA